MFDTLTKPWKRLVLEQRTRRTAREYTRVRPEEIPLSRDGNALKVIWVLAGNEWLGSARLKGLVLDEYFHQNSSAGVFSRVAYMPSHGDFLDPVLHWTAPVWEKILERGIDVVSFQTRNGATESFLQACREKDVATVFSLSDYVPGSVPEKIFALSTAVVVSSNNLAAEISSRHHNIHVIDDAIDVPADCRRQSSLGAPDIELVWLGHGDRWPDVIFLRQVLDCPQLSSLRLRTITRHPEATQQWDPRTVWEHASHSNIAVIPCQQAPAAAAKSSNRLACFMAMGYPVVASPIPSYRQHVQSGVNGFLATTIEEWRASLIALLDAGLRERMGRAALATASIRDLFLPNIAEKWTAVFKSAQALAREQRSAP